ncbi:glycosyltransferase family 4 protein, partial [Candidatus Woesearchaeota archaeon]|nr:glycosyltransferase family 4 protein [Candidatus Woesearchaeota archaeon]
VYNPDISGLLPVYVFDKYPGFKVKTFLDLTQQELDNYIQKNVEAMQKIYDIEKFDIVLTNHAVMSPYIMSLFKKKSGVPYVAKIHGSAIEFTIKHDKKYLDYAVKGLADASIVIAGSTYIKDKVTNLFGASFTKKIEIIPEGVDIEKFSLGPTKAEHFHEFTKKIKQEVDKHAKRKTRQHKDDLFSHLSQLNEYSELSKVINHHNEKYEHKNVDSDVMQQLSNLNISKHKIVVFVGKMLPSKGLYKLVCALAKVAKQDPDYRFVFVGFGTEREGIEAAKYAIQTGDSELFKELVKQRDELDDDLIEFAKNIKQYKNVPLLENSIFVGYATHDLLKHILPLCHISVVPSKVPEAFGMVSIEAMSCGLFPICSNFSGLKDVIDAAEPYVPKNMHNSMKIEMSGNIIDQIHMNILDAAQHIEDYNEDEFRQKMRQIAVENFSWDGTANKTIKSFQNVLKGG